MGKRGTCPLEIWEAADSCLGPLPGLVGWRYSMLAIRGKCPTDWCFSFALLFCSRERNCLNLYRSWSLLLPTGAPFQHHLGEWITVIKIRGEHHKKNTCGQAKRMDQVWRLWDHSFLSYRADRLTDAQTDADERFTPATVVGVSNYMYRDNCETITGRFSWSSLSVWPAGWRSCSPSTQQ